MSWFSRVEYRLDQILNQQARILNLLMKQGDRAMALQDDVNDLVAAVEERKTVGDSVMTLLTELSDMLKANVTDPAAQKQIQDAIAALRSKNKEVSDAVIANTPHAEP